MADYDRHAADDGDGLEPGDAGLPDDELLETEAEVVCPWCAEAVTITLDPGGGVAQEYVEDCQVCCQPWLVRVHYDATGAAEVSVEQS